MKRSEIKVGDELYYDSSPTWATSNTFASKAVVIDNEPYKVKRVKWGRITETHYGKDPKGTCVLVALGDQQKAVPTAHLRGPYEQTKAQVEKAAAEAREAREAESKRVRDTWDEANRLQESARGVGIAAIINTGRFGNGPVMQVSVADFARLLDAYAARIAEGTT